METTVWGLAPGQPCHMSNNWVMDLLKGNANSKIQGEQISLASDVQPGWDTD